MALALGLLLFVTSLAAQPYRWTPPSPRQGDTVRLHAPATATSARMGERTVRLFPQADGNRFGLMPVPVLEKPGAYTLEFLNDAGRVLNSGQLTVVDGRFRRQNVLLSRETRALEPSPGEMETVRAFRQTISDIRYWEEPFASPVPGCMTSPFGVLRLHNGKPTGNYHSGVDQRGASGQPVTAPAAGTVRLVRMFNIHGGTVGIDHGQGLTTTYLHMSRFAVQEGARVKKGDVIGYVGSTGRSTAPHLHWGMSVSSVPVNPLQWLKLAPCAPAGRPGSRRR